MSRERVYFECEECFALLVTQRAWLAAGPDERAEMAAEGYAPQGVGPSCRRCTGRAAYRRRKRDRETLRRVAIWWKTGRMDGA